MSPTRTAAAPSRATANELPAARVVGIHVHMLSADPAGRVALPRCTTRRAVRPSPAARSWRRRCLPRAAAALGHGRPQSAFLALVRAGGLVEAGARRGLRHRGARPHGGGARPNCLTALPSAGRRDERATGAQRRRGPPLAGTGLRRSATAQSQRRRGTRGPGPATESTTRDEHGGARPEAVPAGGFATYPAGSNGQTLAVTLGSAWGCSRRRLGSSQVLPTVMVWGPASGRRSRTSHPSQRRTSPPARRRCCPRRTRSDSPG